MLRLESNYAKDGKGISSLHGEFTLANLKEIYPALLSLLDTFEYSVLDLSRVSVFDSAALQMLAVLKKEAATRHKKFKLANHSACVIELIDLYGATGLFRDKIVVSQESKTQGAFKYGTQPQDFF